jgi:aminoglycoside 3-N-acetyltransferase I
MNSILVRKLTQNDGEIARQVFLLMSDVFGEDRQQQNLSAGYVSRILAQDDFWVLAAFIEGELAGGLTAHTLPMTRKESSEVFIYDIAVRQQHQRKGIGRYLMNSLFEAASCVGIHEVFLSADNEDLHALDFYQAVGGIPSPVTLFSFDTPTNY